MKFPEIFKGTCWMSDSLASFIFYFLPMLFVSCSNVILYILTVASINHISSITNSGHLLSLDSLTFNLKLSNSVTHRDRGRSDLFIYLRIFVVLGITWVFGILVLFAKDGSDIEKVLILCYVVTDSLQVMSEWSLSIITVSVDRASFSSGYSHSTDECWSCMPGCLRR